MSAGPDTLASVSKPLHTANWESYLIPLYGDLRRLAARLLRNESKNNSVVPTGLVHDAVLRLLCVHSITVETREQFLGIAAAQMRRILVEHARRRLAQKRTRPYDSAGQTEQNIGLEEILAVEDLMEQLREADQRAYSVTHLHFYLGLSFAEAGKSLGISEKTAQRDWEYARTWLFDLASKRRRDV